MCGAERFSEVINIIYVLLNAWTKGLLSDVPCALAAGPHSPPALPSGDGALAGRTGGVPGAQMCVRAYGRRVSVVDVREFSVRVRVVSAS